MAQSNNYKAPPILTDGVDYENEKRALKFGECLLLWKKKQAPAIFLTLTEQAHKTILELTACKGISTPHLKITPSPFFKIPHSPTLPIMYTGVLTPIKNITCPSPPPL